MDIWKVQNYIELCIIENVSYFASSNLVKVTSLFIYKNKTGKQKNKQNW